MPYMPESVQKWFKYNMKAYGPQSEENSSSEKNSSCPISKSKEDSSVEQNGHVQNGHATEVPCGPDKKTD